MYLLVITNILLFFVLKNCIFTAMAKLTFLGTGTSDGVPQIGCDCLVCNSQDTRDKRLRTSALIQTEGINIIIDSGIDFRQQALKNKISFIDAILLTHAHTDHVEGITELRPLSKKLGHTIPIYGSENTINEVKKRFNFIFSPIQQGGGLPRIELFNMSGKTIICEKTIYPLPVMHGILPILGFRFGELSYITDASYIPDTTLTLMKESNILVINALREKAHSTHFNFDQAIQIAKEINAKKTYFIHMAHLSTHKEMEERFPENIFPAYDGQTILFDF